MAASTVPRGDVLQCMMRQRRAMAAAEGRATCGVWTPHGCSACFGDWLTIRARGVPARDDLSSPQHPGRRPRRHGDEVLCPITTEVMVDLRSCHRRMGGSNERTAIVDRGSRVGRPRVRLPAT